MSEEAIIVEGAREHNLKNITVAIPRERLTVVTGLSGSGKSSLAFDTLYAEGQRRYVESLSAYARQFLNQLQKPDVDHISGLSPAIAIEQRGVSSNPRSTVSTSTEIHDYLRVLFANIGVQHCPICAGPVQRQSAQDIVEEIQSFKEKTRLMILAPLVQDERGTHEALIAHIRKQGFVRVRINGEVVELDGLAELSARKKHSIEVVVDRVVVVPDMGSRLTDSVELALRQGEGRLLVLREKAGDTWESIPYSERNACLKCDLHFDVLAARHFSFNSHHGACSRCHGLGTELILDTGLIIPDPDVSLEKGAIQAWKKGGRQLIIYYNRVLKALAAHYDFDLATSFSDLPATIQGILINGSGEEDITFKSHRGGKTRKTEKPFEGILPNLQRRYETTDSELVRKRLEGYMTRQHCEGCNGARLRADVLACTVRDQSIAEVSGMSVRDAYAFFDGLKLTPLEQKIAGELVNEVRKRLSFLQDVGLDYLSLDRQTGSLSGGESQRIRLATQIGAGLVGVLYVLDEPTIGLHVRDNDRLIKMLLALRDLGNTVVVVEHDEDMIRNADHVIDLGPGAGTHGGEVLAEGKIDAIIANPRSVTGRYLSMAHTARSADERHDGNGDQLCIVGAKANNLKNIDVTIPLGMLVCVTGVSGSGKSSLVDDILRRALFKKFHSSKTRPGPHTRITGMQHLRSAIVIDQSPIGRTPRSNPATYTGAFSAIRKLFAELPASKVRGFGIGRYSFNVKGGRCETCKGDGLLKLEMHFLPDVYVPCERCRGRRYNSETLTVLYNGKSIADVLDLTVEDALEFFKNVPTIARRLHTLSEVGLGYLQLGQSATTLSGGEAQRIKLSAELSKVAKGETLYLLDEPTTGLHFADIERLLAVLARLRDAGNSIVLIEHNMDVIQASDYIIDLGPEGGDGGGTIVAQGPPEEVATVEASYTGQYLRQLWES